MFHQPIRDAEGRIGCNQRHIGELGITVPFARIRKLSRILRCKPYRRALRRGGAASTEHERLLRLLDCRTIVVIDPHRGPFSRLAPTLVPTPNNISFDPPPPPLKNLPPMF